VTGVFGDRASHALRWAVVVAAFVLPYAGPRLAHAAPSTAASEHVAPARSR